MKKLSKLILILSLSTQITLSRADCQEVLTACDQALTACDKALADKVAESEAQAKAILNQQVEIETLTKEKDGIMNSKALWFALGAIGMGLTIKFVGK